MKTRNRRCFFLAVVTIMLIGDICFAYDEGDFQYWSTAGASFDINKDWKVNFDEEFRLGENGGHLYYQHSDLGFVYKGLADWMELGLNYRQVFEKDNKGTWRRENRPHLNVTLKGQLAGLDVSNRARLEYRDRESRHNLWRYRNKVTLKLPQELTALKLKPYLADEIFIDLDGVGYNRNRFYSGVSFKLTKGLKGEIYYLWQSSRSSGNHKYINVLGTKLKFLF